MNLLTSGEQYLFSKYWGRYDLAEYDEFWEDVFAYYSKEQREVPLPLEYNPLTVRMAAEMLDCPPSKCGLCCFYATVHLKPTDIQRMVNGKVATKEEIDKLLKKDEHGVYMSCSPGGCCFLKDNACSIYKYRPDTCYIFPFGSAECNMGGKNTKQMTIRLKCKPALEVARIFIKGALASGDKLLLPNLMIIKKD